MITYDALSKRPTAFRSLTGLSVPLFDALCREYQQTYTERRQKDTTVRKTGLPRQRAFGAGGRFHHTQRDRLLMALVWLRVYPTYELLGYLFSLHKSNAYRGVEDVLATLDAMTTFEYERPERERKPLGSLQEVMDLFPGVALVIDAKEQRIERPKGTKDDDKQRPYYSGKKKCHTLKNQVGVKPDGHIRCVSGSVPGSTHDLTLLRDSKVLDQMPPDEQAMTDKGYIGIRDDYPDRVILQPFKASRGHPLSETQKDANRLLSSYRIVVEHTMAQLNRFQVLAQRYRKARGKHSRVFRVVAGLVNRCLDVTPLKTYATA